MSSGKEAYLNRASNMYDNTTMYKEEYPNKDDFLNMMSKRYDERFGSPIVKEEPLKVKETKERVIKPGKGSTVLQEMWRRITSKGGKRRKYASKKNKKRKTNKRKH
jgi:hypothetical protein